MKKLQKYKLFFNPKFNYTFTKFSPRHFVPNVHTSASLGNESAWGRVKPPR